MGYIHSCIHLTDIYGAPTILEAGNTAYETEHIINKTQKSLPS